MDDEQIVELFLNRNEDAIRYTSEKYGSRLRQLSFNITGDAQTALECENDTYMEVWELIPPNEPRTYLFPFLSRIIRNLSINCLAQRKRLKRNAQIVELSAEMEECIPAPEDTSGRMESEALGKAISAFLYGLSKEKRGMFLQRYYYMDSVTVIAKRFGFSESKVKTTLFRVRNELREYLIKEGYTI